MTTISPGQETGPGRANRVGWGWWVAWGLLALSCLGVSLFSFPPYLPFVPGESRIAQNTNFPGTHDLVVAMHAVPAGLAMLLGPPQFIGALRNRFPVAHRWTGRAYLVCVAVGGVVALLASVTTASGVIPGVAFFLLAVMWLYSGMKAYTAIRSGNIQLHRVWMIRNFALTFAAVSLRLILVVGLVGFNLPQDEAYAISAWGSILVSYVVAEWLIVQRYMRPTAKRQAL